jgi:putative cell wall-binding protein
MNNPLGQDSPGAGAVPRPGLAALDPASGVPLNWNPGRNPRGGGAAALLATPTGLWVGSDTDYFGDHQYLRPKIGFFPLAGAAAMPSTATPELPGDVFIGAPASAPSTLIRRNYQGGSAGTDHLTSSSIDWTQLRGAVVIGGTLYYGRSNGNFYRRTFDGSAFGAEQQLDPYHDPAWSGVQTGSGQTYQGTTPSFYAEIPTLTSLFFQKGRLYYTRAADTHLYSRAFSPESGIVGEDKLIAPSTTLPAISGAFISGGYLYFATSDGKLHRRTFSGGTVSGADVVVSGDNDHASWRSQVLFIGVNRLSRLSGADRYDAAAAISAASFSPDVPVAYVATGVTFPDALAGAAVAGRQGGPVLLVPGTTIPASVAAELVRLRPQRIVILGGTGSVSSTVESALHFYSGSVTRIGGADRYAVAVSLSAAAYPSPAAVPVAFVATGNTFPDALSGAPLAAVKGGPMLLVPGNTLPATVAAELDRLHPQRIVILGGPGSVSPAVEAALDAHTTGSVTRYSGSDRYAVAAAVSADNFPPGTGTAYVATGQNFPDALAGAAAAGQANSPVLTVAGTVIPDVVGTELTRLHPQRIVILGGPGSVSPAVESQLWAQYLQT